MRSAAKSSPTRRIGGLATAGVARRTAGAIALGAQSAAARVEPVGAARAEGASPAAGAGSAASRIVRFFSASLLRRILISNLMGFFILVGGILYLGWFHTWLIDAKLDALKTQGADHRRRHRRQRQGRARAHRHRSRTPFPMAPARPPASPTTASPSLELSIHPEEVTPILRKLIQPTNTRARIYARDGTLIVDTAQTLARWTAMRNEPTSTAMASRRKRRTSGPA